MGSGRAGFEMFKVQVERSRGERRGDRAAGVVSDGDRGSALRAARAAHLDSPALVVALEGWIDAGLGAGRGGAGARRRPAPDRDRDVRRRPAPRLPRPPPRHAPPRRREHRAHVARHRALRREGPRGPRRAAAPRARARLALEAVHRAGRRPRGRASAPGSSSASARIRSPRRTPGRPACRRPRTRPSSPNALGYLRNSVDVPAGVEAAIERRCAEIGLARRRPVGAGAALRGRDALSPGLDRADRRPRAGRRPLVAGRTRCARRRASTWPGSTSWSRRATSTARCCDQLEAQADAETGGVRGERRRSRRSTRATCRPATTSPPSSSGSSANRAERQPASRSAVSAVSSEPR